MNEVIVTSPPELRGLIREELRALLNELKPTSQPEEILNLQEACDLLCISKPTIYGLTSRRKIPFHKRGKRLLFKRSELLDWISEGRKQTESEIVMGTAKLLVPKGGAK